LTDIARKKAVAAFNAMLELWALECTGRAPTSWAMVFFFFFGKHFIHLQ
jgi:hypothetical protein